MRSYTKVLVITLALPNTTNALQCSRRNRVAKPQTGYPGSQHVFDGRELPSTDRDLDDRFIFQRDWNASEGAVPIGQAVTESGAIYNTGVGVGSTSTGLSSTSTQQQYSPCNGAQVFWKLIIFLETNSNFGTKMKI